jgi:hypothetical protein
MLLFSLLKLSGTLLALTLSPSKSKSKSNSELLYDRRFTDNHLVLPSSLLWITNRDTNLNRTLAVIVLM